MSVITKIEWTDHTFNPWIGCTKVSPGCANCYAEVSTPSRAMSIKWGKGQPRQRTSESYWRQPIAWNKRVEKEYLDWERHVMTQGGHPGDPKPANARVFCASLADVFDSEVPIEWLADLLVLIHKTPYLDWQLLTKRPENVIARLKEASFKTKPDSGDGPWIRNWLDGERPENVWIGTTVEDQARADQRIPVLINIPARVRFLSCEPLLEEIDLTMALESFQSHDASLNRNPPPVQWVIVGGESGRNARRSNVEWIRSIVQQCQVASVPVFVKQLGSHSGISLNTHGSQYVIKHPKGGDPEEWPADLRVRDFPKS